MKNSHSKDAPPTEKIFVDPRIFKAHDIYGVKVMKDTDPKLTAAKLLERMRKDALKGLPKIVEVIGEPIENAFAQHWIFVSNRILPVSATFHFTENEDGTIECRLCEGDRVRLTDLDMAMKSFLN